MGAAGPGGVGLAPGHAATSANAITSAARTTFPPASHRIELAYSSPLQGGGSASILSVADGGLEVEVIAVRAGRVAGRERPAKRERRAHAALDRQERGVAPAVALHHLQPLAVVGDDLVHVDRQAERVAAQRAPGAAAQADAPVLVDGGEAQL